MKSIKKKLWRTRATKHLSRECEKIIVQLDKFKSTNGISCKLVSFIFLPNFCLINSHTWLCDFLYNPHKQAIRKANSGDIEK